MNEGAEYRFPKRLAYADAASVRADGERRLTGASAGLRVSLADLLDHSSIVVAVLLAWVRHAKGLGRGLTLVDVPAELRNIIDLYGVAPLLPLEAGGDAGAWAPAAEPLPGSASGRPVPPATQETRT
ncbi:MAG: lipid asymmetry maintenance protein MlaB [Gammaproteobacteria bacterium]